MSRAQSSAHVRKKKAATGPPVPCGCCGISVALFQHMLGDDPFLALTEVGVVDFAFGAFCSGDLDVVVAGFDAVEREFGSRIDSIAGAGTELIRTPVFLAGSRQV